MTTNEMHFSVCLVRDTLFLFSEEYSMKRKRLLKLLLILSFVANILLAYYVYDNGRPKPKITKWGFGQYNIEVYFERAEDAELTTVNYYDGIIKVGKAELHYKEGLSLVSPYGRFNLIELGGDAFVISSDGELLYQMCESYK